MSSTILLIVLLSAHITGLISEQLLKATVGGSVLINCPLQGYPLTFYWQDGVKNVLFHWKDGNKQEEPNNNYMNRSQIFPSEFRSGNISFRLYNISVEDEQKTFFSYVKFDEEIQFKEWCRSTLQVSAPYQDLVLTVNHTTNSATCSARGGYPEAEVSWKGQNRSNDEEQDLQDAETFLQQDPTEKTFSFTSSVNITGLKTVTCVVYNPHSHETVNRTEKIGADGEIERIDVAAIVVPVVLLVIVGAVLFYLWYKKQRPVPVPLNPKPDVLNPQEVREEDQAQAQDPAPPNERQVNPNAQDGAQAEAADAPDETASLTATGAAYRRHTKSSEDAAASPEKENLLK